MSERTPFPTSRRGLLATGLAGAALTAFGSRRALADGRVPASGVGGR